MREIKFRAWDKKYNIMLAPEAFNRNDVWITGDGKVYEIEEWSSYIGGGKREIDCSEQYVLMQYTGLKDKNGKEIYEGDILTSSEYPFQDDGKYNYHGVIEWIDEEASFYMTKRLANPDKRGISDGISQPIEGIEEFEIIGNIYDNPELLKGESHDN